MAPNPSLLVIRTLRTLAFAAGRQPFPRPGPSLYNPTCHQFKHQFSTTTPCSMTLNQVRKKGRHAKKDRPSISPALVGRPQMKGVCLKVGVTKPKKPNSGQRKTAKVRLTSGKIIDAFIPGEGEFPWGCFGIRRMEIRGLRRSQVRSRWLAANLWYGS